MTALDSAMIAFAGRHSIQQRKGTERLQAQQVLCIAHEQASSKTQPTVDANPEMAFRNPRHHQ